MSSGRMHGAEVDTSADLVRRLLAAQFPQWASLPIAAVRSAGTDNALYRLGDELVVRLPRIHWAVRQVEKEHEWLPRLAPHLPLAIPTPVAKGEPGEGYAWHWSVYLWLKGGDATVQPVADEVQAALDLAHFVSALQRVDATDGPKAGENNSSRGLPLAQRDAATCEAMASLKGMVDMDVAAAVWEAALDAPTWQERPVWIHGDLHAGNLLVVERRLSAVIDFGCLGVGDPACDVMAAWLYLPARTRDLFRNTLSVDDATWTRARGWALHFGLVALPYYRHSNPSLAATARRAIDEAIADFRATG